MADQLDCVIIGAGVVGLAVGRSLALAGREVVVLEAEPEIGMHTSSRNSEVIHAGLYYPEGSLKAQLCVRGRKQLYEYCESHHVPVNRIGKLIVAAGDAEHQKLLAIQSRKCEAPGYSGEGPLFFVPRQIAIQSPNLPAAN